MAEIGIDITEIFLAPGFQETIIFDHEVCDFFIRKLCDTGRDQLLSFMNREFYQFLQVFRPFVVRNNDQLLEIPLQMLETFDIPE